MFSYQEVRPLRSIRWIAIVLVAAGAFLSVQTASAAPRLTTQIAEQQVALWRCQDQLSQPRSRPTYEPWELRAHHVKLRPVLNLWTTRRKTCINHLHERAEALRKGQLYRLTTRDLYAAADAEVARGGIYSQRWGDASPLLRNLCYEALDRAFGARASWARYIVNRESGCNPGATNTTYSSWNQQAKCIAQMIPAYHAWIDYRRCQRDLRYSIEVFVHLSRGGLNTSPWAYY